MLKFRQKEHEKISLSTYEPETNSSIIGPLCKYWMKLNKSLTLIVENRRRRRTELKSKSFH